MDWITGIQNAIDYVEDNILNYIDYKEVARKAYSSSFHFQRVFSLLCGDTLGDYIRLRRLTLAGAELASKNSKVIDVALKYGYESPESFSRAFTRFHGVSPSSIKNGENIKSFSRISVKLTPTSGYSPCNGVAFEAYPSADVSDPNYSCEIWITVEKK